MKPEHYVAIDSSLGLGRRLVTGPKSYETAYNLPLWLPRFSEDLNSTPRTLVLPGTTFDLDKVADKVLAEFKTRLSRPNQERVRSFDEEHLVLRPWIRPWLDEGLMELPGPRPVLLKDYLKSAKHKWFEACFIPDCRDREHVKEVTKNFLDIQGDNLTGGLCFRQFEPGKQIGIHSKTRAPIVNEWRVFLSYGKVIYLAPYWAEGDYGSVARPQNHEVEHPCDGLKDLPFVAVDFGELERGGWIEDFYCALKGAFE